MAEYSTEEAIGSLVGRCASNRPTINETRAFGAACGLSICACCVQPRYGCRRPRNRQPRRRGRHSFLAWICDSISGAAARTFAALELARAMRFVGADGLRDAGLRWMNREHMLTTAFPATWIAERDGFGFKAGRECGRTGFPLSRGMTKALRSRTCRGLRSAAPRSLENARFRVRQPFRPHLHRRRKPVHGLFRCPEDVRHLPSSEQQHVRDQPPVATPPKQLRTHYRRASGFRGVQQRDEPLRKFVGVKMLRIGAE